MGELEYPSLKNVYYLASQYYLFKTRVAMKSQSIGAGHLPDSGLNSGILTPLETLAQSISLLAPTVTPAMVVPLVFASAGNATYLVFVFAMVGLLLTEFTLNHFSQRSASAGSLYGYTMLGLGADTATITGWALLFAYIAGGSAALIGFANYSAPATDGLVGLRLDPMLLIVGCIGASWWLAYKDVRLSTKLMLYLECLSVLMIIALIAVTLWHFGYRFDQAQLNLVGATPEGFRLGLVLAIFSFVGFESASTLGHEAQSPLKSIPRAMVLSILITGILFICASYSEIIGFIGNSEPLSKSDAPLNTLALRANLPLLAVAIDVGASISFFACVLACVNAAARVLFSMAHQGVFHHAAKKAHEHNRTPHIAISISALVMLVPTATLVFMGQKLIDVYGWIGTISSYGFITAYIIACIASPIYLYRHKDLKASNVVVAILAIGFMTMAFVGNLWPVPSSPYNLLPYIFLAYMVLAVISSLWVRRKFKDLSTKQYAYEKPDISTRIAHSRGKNL